MAATTANEYPPFVVDRVRLAIRRWRATAEVDAPILPALDTPVVAASSTVTSLGTGASLDSSTRTRMEAALGMPLGGVLVHTNSAAQSFVASSGARAIAVGRHIAFANNEYRPGTEVGDAMLAQRTSSRTHGNSGMLPLAAPRSTTPSTSSTRLISTPLVQWVAYGPA